MTTSKLDESREKAARPGDVTPDDLTPGGRDRLAVALGGALRWIDAALADAEGGRVPRRWPDGSAVAATEEGGRP